jgi:hypothetical protein
MNRKQTKVLCVGVLMIVVKSLLLAVLFFII